MSERGQPGVTPLETLDAIRRRPGMYIGNVHDSSGLHHMLWEVVSNVLDQYLAGRCRSATVTLHEGGGVSIEDDGEGIPVEVERGGVSLLEIVLTTLHASGTFDGHSPHVHAGLLGVGLVAVNALSSSLVVEVWRRGRHYRQGYRQGRPEGPVAAVGATDRQGTRLTFTPDPSIFKAPAFDATLVGDRLRELAFLFPGLALHFADERRPRFCYERGVADYVAHLNRAFRPRHEPLACRGEQGLLAVDAALQWAEGGGQIVGFVNGLRTIDGGTHIKGLSHALARMFFERTKVARTREGGQRRRVVDAMTRGLAAVVHVRHHDPTFDMPTRSKLTNPEVTLVVANVLTAGLRRFCQEQPEQASAIIEGARLALHGERQVP
ncbi:MAG: ATP-binding protein [Polyangiaceae bacterium]|nr:ATP-binding protein [Polyangiaceae bacterium]